MEFEKPISQLCSLSDRIVRSPEYRTALQRAAAVRRFRNSFWNKISFNEAAWLSIDMSYEKKLVVSSTYGAYDFARIRVAV